MWMTPERFTNATAARNVVQRGSCRRRLSTSPRRSRCGCKSREGMGESVPDASIGWRPAHVTIAEKFAGLSS